MGYNDPITLIRPSSTVSTEDTARTVPDLRRGDTGERVRDAQRKLAWVRVDGKAIFTGRVDGSFGPDTERAVKAFQKSQGIAETGIIDDATALRLRIAWEGPGHKYHLLDEYQPHERGARCHGPASGPRFTLPRPGSPGVAARKQT